MLKPTKLLRVQANAFYKHWDLSSHVQISCAMYGWKELLGICKWYNTIAERYHWKWNTIMKNNLSSWLIRLRKNEFLYKLIWITFFTLCQDPNRQELLFLDQWSNIMYHTYTNSSTSKLKKNACGYLLLLCDLFPNMTVLPSGNLHWC